jgi:hypothetical protein
MACCKLVIMAVKRRNCCGVFPNYRQETFGNYTRNYARQGNPKLGAASSVQTILPLAFIAPSLLVKSLTAVAKCGVA